MPKQQQPAAPAAAPRSAWLAGFTWALASVLLAILPSLSQAETRTRTSSFLYDDKGLLIQETVEPSSPNDCLRTETEYYPNGNKKSTTTSACAGASGLVLSSAAPRTASTLYDQQGRFPTTVTNALDQSESKEFDARFGLVTKLTGPNGLTTTWEYDGFGRKKMETRADGTHTKWQYLYCTDAGADCPDFNLNLYLAVSGYQQPNQNGWVAIQQDYAKGGTISGPETRQFHDSLNRVFRLQTTGFDGAGTGAVLVQDTAYNHLGQVTSKSDVYALAGGNPALTTFEYDALGRVTVQSTPDPSAGSALAVTKMLYEGLKTTVTNAKNHSKITEKNAQGQVAKVTDELSGTVEYSYNALGQLTQTNAGGMITTLTYNQRGQKILMQDPAMGTWEYKYNAFGELVEQTDSLGQVVSIAYDGLGRMTKRTEPDLTSNWYYDKKADRVTACGKSVGKLCEATTDNGYRRTHSYDGLGRPITTSTVLDNAAAPAVVSVAYQPNTGRVQSKTWPTGYQASYTYTTSGYLKKVDGGGTAGFAQTASYEVLAMDARGQITQYRYGNQITTVNDLDAITGRLKGRTATLDGQGTGNVFNQTYQYDALSNLTTRTDSLTGVQESFGYDKLNRLIEYINVGGAVSPPTTTQVLYDSLGNIKYKSDVGHYWYDPERANRLTNITLDSNVSGATTALSGQRALTYAFDDYRPGAKTLGGTAVGNGNLWYTVSQDLSNNRHTVRWETYTSFNMPQQIQFGALVNSQTPANTVADRKLTFVYGPEHQRIRQTVQLTSNAPSSMQAGTTWYLNGEDSQGLSYEKEVKENGITEHKHYLSAGGMVFAMQVTRTGAIDNSNPLKAASTLSYFHHDHLGSIAAISNAQGAVVERLAFDPWGKRRNANGLPDPADSVAGSYTDRGFTMHEHLDEVGVTHMNGRIYDPLIGRFMSADPFIQFPDNLQGYNRYAYVQNNPLNLVDPSGYKISFKKLVKIAVVVAVAIVTQGAVNPYMLLNGYSVAAAKFGAAVAAGAASSFVSSGGDLKATAQGAFTAALFAGASFAGGPALEGASSFERYAAHAAAGCISSVAGGGSCGPAAASAVFGKFATNNINLGSDFANGVGATVAGGVGSVIAGGKFENGATTAAFGYLFNCLAHKCNGADYGSEKSGFHEYGPMEQQLCNESQGGCMAAARQQLMCNSAPGQASCGSPGRLVENNLSGGNPVTQYAVNPDMIINGTSPGHVFHDGYVVRWLSVNEAGNVSVWTYGRGNNSNLATQIGNQLGGSLIFLKKGAENRAGVRRALNE